MKKYMHVERLGNIEVEGILSGECYLFPKLDGTNGSIWITGGDLCFGSRNRELSLDNDNQGFMNSIMGDELLLPELYKFFSEHPDVRIFGEFLVPHTIKRYRDEAWRRFYVFDMMLGDCEYVCYNQYSDWCLQYPEISGLIIPPIEIVNRPTMEHLVNVVEGESYLMATGAGPGEGIVIKRYDYKNKWGRTVWAKLKHSRFIDNHVKGSKTKRVEMTSVCHEIAEKYIDFDMVEKTISKISAESGGWSSRHIQQLFGRIYHDIVSDYMWQACKDFKRPTVDFRNLQHEVVARVKTLKPELF